MIWDWIEDNPGWVIPVFMFMVVGFAITLGMLHRDQPCIMLNKSEWSCSQVKDVTTIVYVNNHPTVVIDTVCVTYRMN